MTTSRMASIGRRLVAAQLLGASICFAQVTAPGFESFKHVRVAADDGAPDGILRIAQTADGYLWFAGDFLYRFDGASFEQIDWPVRSGKRHASPSALMVSGRGELWVGLRDGGGVAVYRQGALRDMHMPDPPRGLALLAQLPDRSVWAASMGLDKRLQRLRGSRWERVDEALGLPPGYIANLVVARDGGLWVALSGEDGKTGSLAYLAPKASRFRPVAVRLSARPKIALDANGALWASDTAGTRLLFDASRRPPRRPIAFAPAPDVVRPDFTFDPNGGIWGTTSSVGIFHIADPLAPGRRLDGGRNRFTAANGLTSDVTYTPFVDREGNVWIGTEGGIDQFRRASAVQEPSVPPDAAHGLTIASAPDGTIYIASRRTLFRVGPGIAPEPIHALREDEVSLCRARAGGVWALEADRTMLIEDKHVRTAAGYRGHAVRIACAEDRDGRLWLALTDGALLWRDIEGWHRAEGRLGALDPWDMEATPAGDLALITRTDLAILHGDRLEMIPLQDTGVGSLWALLPGTRPGSRDLFVSGSAGFVRLRDGRISHLDEARFPWITWVRTLQQTPAGETWLFNRTGAYRVSTDALDRAFDDARAPLPYTRFDALDGLTSTVQHGGFSGRQSALDGSGRIWFLNRQGAAFLAPASLKSNELAPPVAIRSLASGGRTWRDPAHLVLPPGTRSIDLAYAGLSFTIPQRVRFRYRLEGADEHWVDAGARRTASYANLGPGKYHFRVTASNNDGVWNPTGTALDFEIRPTFVESRAFRLLCAAALIAFMWLAYSVRLRAVARSIRLRMAERIDERERIARELHDTLLQAVQSLTLRFQLAADDLPPKTAARAALVDAIDTADRVIAEGRDRVRELRTAQDGDLAQALCDLVARIGFPPSVEVTIESGGTPRRLDPLAVEEVVRIAGEALFNAKRHAGATRVTSRICYGATFELRVADDGVGIDPDVTASGSKPGHYGLVGMSERARKLGGTLRVSPRPGGGTEMVLLVPGPVAYPADDRRRLMRWWRRA